MDDILKKTLRKEIQALFDELEEVVNKYSGNVVYTMAVGFVEDETEDARKWNLAYGWNCKDDDEFAEFLTLQVEAFNNEGEADDWLHGLSLN